MGLLDEAIREHLELKRLRGADPGEVAFEEHEAFGDAREHEGTAGGDVAGPGLDASADLVSRDDERANGRSDGTARTGASDEEASSKVGQETLELDMTTVLYGEPDAEVAGPAPVGPVGDGLAAGAPRMGHGSPSSEGPTQERFELE